MKTQNTGYQRQFCYIYGNYQFPGRDGELGYTKWKRIHEDQIEKEILVPAKNYNCFASIQRWASPHESEGELQWCPLYFDLDGTFEQTRGDAVKLLQYFCGQRFDLPQGYVRVWFSGGKGFHVLINGEILGVKPHKELTYIHKRAALFLENFLSLKTVDSASIYSIRRMWRVPDSHHHKSGLFKVELTPHELMNLSEEEIKALAKKPRGPLYEAEDLMDIRPDEDLQEWHQQFVDAYEDEQRLMKLKPTKPIAKSKEIPVCVKDLLDNHIRVEGTRNKATLTLATYFKDQGHSEKETLKILMDWVAKTPQQFTSMHDVRALKASVKGVVSCVYTQSDQYRFACSYIRSLGNPENPIQCSFDQCKIANASDQEPETPIECHLSEASKAEFLGKKARIKVMASGKDTSPYVVGSRFRVTCKPNADRENSRCLECQMLARGGLYEFSLGPQTPELLQLINCNINNQKGALKSIAHIPQRCTAFKIEQLEAVNIEEIKLIPQIDNSLKDMEYVVRRGFYVGQNFKTNEEYEVDAYLWPDPSTQYAIHTFSDVRSSKNTLSTFTVTPELYKELQCFQPAKNQSVDSKMAEIHRDLERNVTRAWGRSNIAIAVDLTFHSVLGFTFQGEVNPRGWLQLLILGDTRQAKSQISERLIQHYNAGYKLDGETAGRTGLVYNIQENAKRWFLSWGAIPMHDKRLVCIDEFSGLPKEEIELLSSVRSSGVAEVQKVISARTNARTRLIFISNSRSGRPLNNYTFGVEAVAELMGKTEDIARLDLAVTAASGEVAPELINRSISDIKKVPHQYTSYLCSQLVLWAWTRTAEQVTFTPKAEEKILAYANSLAENYSADIPLIEPAELRIKLARLSAAFAARLFSTPDGHALVIEEEHVHYIARYLQDVYNNSALRYGPYSALRKMNQVDESQFERLKWDMRSLPDYVELTTFLLDANYIIRKEMEDQLDYDRDTSGRVMKWLSKNRFLTRTSRGFRKSPAGIRFLMHVAATDLNLEVAVTDEEDPWIS